MRTMTFKIAIAIALLLLPTTVSAQDGEGVERAIEGVWFVTISPRDCTTGDPIPNAAFETLYTFHKDETMLVSFRNNSLTLERTAAHGLWRRDRGWSNYSYKFVHIRRNITTGAFAGKQESGGSLELHESGDEFTTEGWTIVYNASGVPGNPSCSTSAGTRFKLEP